MELSLVDIENFVTGIEAIYRDMNRYKLTKLGDFKDYSKQMNICKQLMNVEANIEDVFNAMYISAWALRNAIIGIFNYLASRSYVEIFFTCKYACNKNKMDNLNKCADRLFNILIDVKGYM